MVAQMPSLQKLDFGASIALTAHGSQFCRPASGLSETKRRVQLAGGEEADQRRFAERLVQKLLN
jgi:hypothetical protein